MAGGAHAAGGDGAGRPLAALQRRTLQVLVATQLLSGAGLAAGVTVGALLTEDVLGSTALAGLSAAALTAGSSAAALAVGAVSQRSGRRPGLALGYLVGALGAVVVVAAAQRASTWLLMAGFVLYGAGSATNLQARYAGADLAAPGAQGRAVSTVLVATTAGAVAGPVLVPLTGDLAAALGLPRLAGPFVLAAVAYAAAAVVLTALLRPDPLLVARDRAVGDADAADASGRWRRDLVATGAAVMVVAQLVMVGVMTMTPLHMRDHGHGLGATGLVIGLHVAAMFLPSPVTGRWLDRAGAGPVVAGAGVTLVAAGLLAAAAPEDSVVLLALALVLLGLGWNFGLVGGTALVTVAVPVAERARVQGRVDVGVSLAAATGGVGSGLLAAATSYAVLGVVAAACSALLVLALRRAGGAVNA